MKKYTARKGFTLVEIMIVVVIIGLLAALGLPYLRKARNSALEKTLIADAKNISTAFNTYTSEQSVAACTLVNLVGPGKPLSTLSSGTKIINGSTQPTTLWNAATAPNIKFAGVKETATNGSIISLGNDGYDATLSTNAAIASSATGGYGASTGAGSNYLSFAVETATLLRKAATNASTDILVAPAAATP